MQERKSSTSGIPFPCTTMLRDYIADTGGGRQRVENPDVPDTLREKGLEVGWHNRIDFIAMLWDEEVFEEKPLIVREAHGHGRRKNRRDA